MNDDQFRSDTDNTATTRSISGRNTLLFGLFGPAIVLLAFGQATGELIHWPYLTAKYGLHFLFLLLPACLLQIPMFYFLGRHTLITGESYFPTLIRANKIIGILFAITFVLTSVWIASYTSSGGIGLVRLWNELTPFDVDLSYGASWVALALNALFFVLLLFLSLIHI